MREIDAEAAARLINGAALSASLWIASATDPRAVSGKAVESFLALASGLLRHSKVRTAGDPEPRGPQLAFGGDRRSPDLR